MAMTIEGLQDLLLCFQQASCYKSWLVHYTTIGGRCYLVLFTRESDGWINAAKFLTGASTVGSIAIPIILRHAHMIETPAMWIEFFSFFIFVCTVMCFHRASLEDEW
ncbi:unnamed protein product [Malus baccata var. baccata]